MSRNLPSNKEIAGVLEQIADLLEVQDANPFRVRAYRDAAGTIQDWGEPVAEMVAEGQESLEKLPNIGEGLAGVISDYVTTGRSDMLLQLQAEVAPEQVLQQVPGIGEELAKRVVNELGVNTIAELEQAAHDGTLAQVEGFGPERVQAVRLATAGMLSGAAQKRRSRIDEETPEPSIETLLDVDEEYRTKAAKGGLKKIAPRRFNPENEAWLPILNTKRGDWKFTALFSNTEQAHDLNKTDDWVVLYFERPGMGEQQRTVVTETRGPLKGKRVVRGREKDTRRHYESA